MRQRGCNIRTTAHPPTRSPRKSGFPIRFRQSFALVLFLSSAVLAVAATAPPPAPVQVAFIGDQLTLNWQHSPQFQAQANWLPYGFSPPFDGTPNKGTGPALVELNAIIASGKKPLIHLMVEQGDADMISGGIGGNTGPMALSEYGQGFEKIIKTAQAANLKIIVGLEPFSLFGTVHYLNEWTALYCHAHNIPVIDYASALGRAGLGPYGNKDAPPVYLAQPQSDPNTGQETALLTTAGYALITDMAETQIGLTTGAITLKGGYLGANVLNNVGSDQTIQYGANQATTTSPIQFTPYGVYSDGKTRIMNNEAASPFGGLGTWSSSNQTVVSIPPYGSGTAKAYGTGTATVLFMAPDGHIFSAWGMTVYAPYGVTF